jgi:uncharacterized membrane protein YeiH
MSLLRSLPLLIGGVTEPPLYIGLAATFLGALSGSIFSGERKFPITGVLAIAIAVGLGGGIIRDVLLGVVPVAFTSAWYLPTAIAAAFIGFFFASLARLGNILILVLDPIWMALFAVIGAQKALNADLSPFAAMFIGCVTAFGGGVLRDLLSHEKPELVKPGPINYAAAMLGSILYVLLVYYAHLDKVPSEWITIVFVFSLRMLSLKFGIKAPQPVDLAAKLPVVGPAVAPERHARKRRPDELD